ncbi:MAG: hypothetical protein K2W96_20205 [Gemmataceae bacterium]|nr:hypothetical protein [Gemmataceae bacterium]
MAEKPMGIDDLVMYGGAGAGMIAGYLTLQAMEMNRIVCLIGGLLCGMLLGFICEQVWQRMKAPPRGPDDGPPGGYPR